MLFVGASLGSNPTSPNLDHSPSPDQQLNSPSPAFLPQFPPCWATQARENLAQAEKELQRLQERHGAECESVKRGIERAILGARREEQRLLERVQQDHRDSQQYLEQVQRDNMAAVRVSQSLLDQRLQKLTQLQQWIGEVGQQSGLDGSEANQNLLKEISEFLQPWEISVSLKKVNFKPSSQPHAIAFGDIRVQEQSLSLHSGVCGPQGQLCALHSHKMQCKIANQECTRREKDDLGQGWTSPSGRVVRKINLSTTSDMESQEEQQSTKIRHWLPKCEQSDWESSQDDEIESGSFQQQDEDGFLTVPKVLKDMESEDKEQAFKRSRTGMHCSPKNQRKSLSVASGRELSPLSEGTWEHSKPNHCLGLDSQDGDKGKVSQDSNCRHYRYGNSVLTSPRVTSRQLLTSQSCQDLSTRDRPYSRFSQSSDEHSLGTHGDSGRAPSPTDSLDSSYTFIVNPSPDYSINRGSLNYSCNLSKSAVDLTHKTRPLITSGINDRGRTWRLSGNSMSSSTSTSPTLSRGHKISDFGQILPYPSYRGHNTLHKPQKEIQVAALKPLVARSLSMSVLDGSSQESKKSRAPILVELGEEGDPSLTLFAPRGVLLIRQFGKQGTGRADFTLPSGVHSTPQGQLFIVDCGNARIQVTDPRGNVLQQVTSPNSDGSARRCRNYFDLAVNSKGLIALSCAAERALLVFSRHGRLLQTFGGSGLSSTKDELEAPRGVTVTRLDEFLVADIRKGTLIALKLDPKTGSRLERTVVTGFHRPYLVAACVRSGIIAVSERGNETGHVPCIKVLEPGWNTVRVLGVCAGMGPVLSCPWGICIDTNGNVLVADWGEEHRVLLYPAQGVGWPIITEGLSSPRGLTLLPEGQLVVSDSMHHCVKIYKYKGTQDQAE